MSRKQEFPPIIDPWDSKMGPVPTESAMERQHNLINLYRLALIDALTDMEFAALRFSNYEALHTAKATQKSMEKARANREMADRLRRTIARIREVMP